ncbi:CHL4-domain-containing protein [Xylona heveae TC161]|uniref:CHL4-domain-containing protein n=1 Tax=Xylona heveae (strain CBS 132557 / TC161) TaxID=1328760 RepID=A0A165J695_XYLHT|nr:CHL4-domain-containing protein [Xylona heveae TC161]KZF25790.1 CHL4-domain-containing protein [Xylona heveae TC161]
MAPRPRLSLPTAAPLPHTLRLPADHSSVLRTLSKLSRSSLLALVQQWLRQPDKSLCSPCLAEDAENNDADDDIYPLAQNTEELQDLYLKLQERKSGKRDVIDRILEGDWRQGITLYQLATADLLYLLEHNSSQKWTAMKLASIAGQDDNLTREAKESLPRFHAPTFLRNLQSEVAPLVKAHYYLARVEPLSLAILRVHIHDSPYNNQRSMLDHLSNGAQTSGDGSRVLYVVFPDNCPMVYISLISSPGQAAGVEGRNLRRMVIEALPRAFSRSRARYSLESTSLTARSLSALLALRGPGRGNNAAGGWSIFAEGTVEDSPLNHVEPSMREPIANEDSEHNSDNEKVGDSIPAKLQAIGLPAADEATKKRLIEIAGGRFGCTGLEGDGKGIERLDIRLKDQGSRDEQPSESRLSLQQGTEQDSLLKTWSPQVQLAFHGSHVIAGIRRLVETGAVDGEKMPSWMTGEAGVSVGVVQEGKIKDDNPTV